MSGLSARNDSFHVSIHAPAWGATSLFCLFDVSVICFNPRTRVGCDVINHLIMFTVVMFQSTHPRGVRPRDHPRCRRGQRVSIHAPAWGATSKNASSRDSIDVSIHAPTWGATARAGRAQTSRLGFNPRTRVGCDALQLQRTIPGHTQFQSTHPRGVRREPPTWLGFEEQVSIHAPAWGATR